MNCGVGRLTVSLVLLVLCVQTPMSFSAQQTTVQPGERVPTSPVNSARPDDLAEIVAPRKPSVKALAAGLFFSLVLMNDGTLWGLGSVFLGKDDEFGTPKKLMTDVEAIAAGSSFWLALKNDGTLWSSGDNYFGQLGDGTSVARLDSEMVMQDVGAVAAGSEHSLVVKTDRTLWAFGRNDRGQLGDGTTQTRLAPIQIMTGVKAAAGGSEHSVVLKTDGTLWAFGSNGCGELGDGTNVDRPSPRRVLSGLKAIAAGERYSAGLRNDGTLWVFGATGNVTKVPTLYMRGVTELASGVGGMPLVMKADHSAWFVRIGGPQKLTDNAKVIAVGNQDYLVAGLDGSLWGYGDDRSGQLGAHPVGIGDIDGPREFKIEIPTE